MDSVEDDIIIELPASLKGRQIHEHSLEGLDLDCPTLNLDGKTYVGHYEWICGTSVVYEAVVDENARDATFGALPEQVRVQPKTMERRGTCLKQLVFEDA